MRLPCTLARFAWQLRVCSTQASKALAAVMELHFCTASIRFTNWAQTVSLWLLSLHVYSE